MYTRRTYGWSTISFQYEGRAGAQASETVVSFMGATETFAAKSFVGHLTQPHSDGNLTTEQAAAGANASPTATPFASSTNSPADDRRASLPIGSG